MTKAPTHSLHSVDLSVFSLADVTGAMSVEHVSFRWENPFLCKFCKKETLICKVNQGRLVT